MVQASDDKQAGIHFEESMSPAEEGVGDRYGSFAGTQHLQQIRFKEDNRQVSG
jgi:hypothetical protein